MRDLQEVPNETTCGEPIEPEHDPEVRISRLFIQIHECTTKDDVFNITENEALILAAVYSAPTVEVVTLLLSCVDLASDINRDLLVDALPRVQSLEIAEFMVDTCNSHGIPIDFDHMTALVPYYATELDLQLVSYFIHNGGSPKYFIKSYLEELCDHDPGLRDMLQPYIEEQAAIEQAQAEYEARCRDLEEDIDETDDSVSDSAADEDIDEPENNNSNGEPEDASSESDAENDNP
jgi:hypothetical protein